MIPESFIPIVGIIKVLGQPNLGYICHGAFNAVAGCYLFIIYCIFIGGPAQSLEIRTRNVPTHHYVVGFNMGSRSKDYFLLYTRGELSFSTRTVSRMSISRCCFIWSPG